MTLKKMIKMKSTEQFKDTIKAYLDKRAAEDALFAEKYANEKKNIEDCCTYILDTVQKSGKNAFADEEIFGMAVHYYDEEAIEVGKPVNNVKVVVPAPSGSPQGGEKAARRQADRARGRQGDKATGKEGKVKGKKGDSRLRGNDERAKPVIVERSLFD